MLTFLMMYKSLMFTIFFIVFCGCGSPSSFKPNMDIKTPNDDNITYTNKDLYRDDYRQVIVDNVNHLMWQDDLSASTITYTWLEANSACGVLALNNYYDWSLPDYDTLTSIREDGKKFPATKDVFKYSASNRYWTSEDINRVGVWYVDMGDNMDSTEEDKTKKYYTRCVRHIRD